MSSTMSGFLLKLLFKSNKSFDSTTRNTEHGTQNTKRFAQTSNFKLQTFQTSYSFNADMSSTMSGFLLKLLFKSNKNFDSTTRNKEHEKLPPNFKLFKLQTLQTL